MNLSCHAINNFSEGTNGMRMLSGGNYKTDIEVGPFMMHEWVNVKAYTPYQMGSAPNMLLR